MLQRLSCADQVRGRDIQMGGDRQQVGLMRFEERDHCGQKRRIADAGAKLVCPDSGQCQEPFGTRFVHQRCCQRAKGERLRVVC